MHRFIKPSVLTALFLASSNTPASDAFAPLSTSRISNKNNMQQKPQTAIFNKQSRNSFLVRMNESTNNNNDDEIQRLKSMAAKLRAEAAALEAEKAQELADAAEKAFRKFDINQDGEISLEELKAGLEKMLKTEISDTRIQSLMKSFDSSGDGALQLDEFVTIDKFRNTLEKIARDEKQAAAAAKQEAKFRKEEAAMAAAVLELINDKPPTNSDKLLSILPYLFPLMDSLQYGRFLLADEGPNNPFVLVLALLYTLYRNIPFSGFIAFFALNILSGNFSLNRLIRFNLQQAIFIDIALFFPGLISGIFGLVAQGANLQLPEGMSEIFTDGVFVTLLVTLAYCSISSLLGVTPDKVPLVSDAVSQRMPSIEMFDEKGNFIGRKNNNDEEEKKD